MKKLSFIFFLLLLFLLSYFREVTFIGINSIIAGQEHNYANTALPALFSEMETSNLIQLKWILTGFYSLIFMLVSYFGIKNSIGKSASLWIALIYVLIVSIAAIVLSIGTIAIDFQTVYPFLRLMIEIIHSPILFLLISIIHYSMSIMKKS